MATGGKGSSHSGSDRQSDKQPDQEPNHGFALPDADFDPWNNQAIKDYYAKKQKEGVLNDEDGIEDDVETEARQVVTNWEKVVGREATAEERQRMMSKIRRIRGGAWLEGLKTKLVGETTVPIAYFNRLVAENERCIAFVANRMAAVAQERQKMGQEIDNLRDANEKLTTGGLKQCEDEKAELTDKAAKLADDNSKLQEQIDSLREKLEKEGKQPPVDDKCKERIERLESELRAVHRQRQIGEEMNESLERQLKESRKRENAVRNEMRDQDREIRGLHETLDELTMKNNRLEREAKRDNKDDSAKDSEKELRDKLAGLEANLSEQEEANQGLIDENDGLVRRIHVLRDQVEAKPTATGSGAPSKTFDTAKIVKELMEAKEQDRAVNREVERVLSSWMSNVAEANHLREYHNAVQEYKNGTKDLQNRVLALYEQLGHEAEEDVTADQALANLSEQLQKQPQSPMEHKLWTLKLLQDLAIESNKLRAERLRAQTLHMRLEDGKTAEQRRQETQMAYRIFDEEELDRRVEERTQMYREHRGEILDNIFDAANALQSASRGCPDAGTREMIDLAVLAYLSPASLPKPKVPSPRR
ncbi:uncharacterized protein F4807DRAFT_462767 [Annulohypoxylon truncatum]|uniref:uncharacterized protein n=1 Tax=Annulohypoxylon truncatum TaxID=327061 RepID=UPI0020084AEA|nr:uncharacterized protein F4807DRAFT_462767 [Annulohypoxylon truncatum]KAI1207317.1 hypothetical protein F4807DRAFT_462767 [Annulohypoxylon truncatum]